MTRYRDNMLNTYKGEIRLAYDYVDLVTLLSGRPTILRRCN